jgi:hypothetical protein
VIYNLPSERFIVVTPPSAANEEVEDVDEDANPSPPKEQTPQSPSSPPLPTTTTHSCTFLLPLVAFVSFL